MNSERIRRLAVRGALGLSLLATALSGLVAPLFAQTASVCTIVKLELEQKAALEREAFNARLVLTNNQADMPLSSLRVTISIKDSLGNPADALFFNKVTDMAGVSAVDGSGTMQPAAQADIKWLIIPSPGAGGSLKEGTPYSVTAQISYVSGETPSVNVTQPAYITVYPQPLLSLEYLLPFEVFGVDPFTLTGTTEPFPLGLRVSNVGAGTAVNFQIASGQPEITDNKQGLPISFQVIGAFLNSNPLPTNTLIVPFGNIAPGGSSLASWQLTSSYSGRFTDFTVTATHDASLGGALTSLIQGVTTYTVMKDVVNDRPGHDAQYDLLVNVGTPRSRMESDYQLGLEPKPDALIDSDRPGFTPVKHVPAHLGGSLSGSNAVLNVVFDQAVPTGTWVHTSIPFPQGDSVPLKSVIRSDGKAINPRNAWIAKHIDKLTNTRTHFLHVLDYTSSESAGYAMTFDAASLITPPDAISNLSAQPDGQGALALSWNATGASGSSGMIVGGRYAIFASTDPAAVPGVASAAVSFSTATEALARQEYLLTGLLGNATYQIGVFLANAAGQFSAVSNMAVVQTPANPPTDVQVVSITTSGFSLTWTTSTNRAGAEYQVALSSAGQTAFVADQSSAVFSGLDPNRTYSVTSVERNSSLALTPAIVIAAVTTLALPPATTSPAFVSITTDSVGAQWLLDGNPPDTEFFSELSTAASRAPVFAASGWVRASSFTFAGLPAGTTFYGRVKARNRMSVETSYADLGAVRTAPVDNLPPRTSLVVGSPRFGASPVYVATGTLLSLSAVDDKAAEGDGIGLGAARTFFAIDSSTFAAYSGTFTLTGFGAHTIQFYSVDVLGNAEVVRGTQVIVAEPPAAVVDLILAAVNPSSVTLRWTEPVSTVPHVSYDLRRATFPITADTFDAAISIPAPAPASSGTVLTVDVSGVTEPGFYAALVSRDVLGGVSPLSNVAGLTRSTVMVNGSPELAFSANQPVTAILLSPAEGQGAVAFASAAPVGLILVSSIYDLGPEGAVFDPAAALTLRYSTAALAAVGLVPSDLAVYQYVADLGWVAVSTQTLDSDNRSVTAAVPSLASIFALLGKSHVPPSLALTPVDGGTVTIPTPRITAVYSAIGPGVAPATVRLTLDGSDVTASAIVTTSSASFVPAEALSQGSHTVTAAVADYAGNVATASSTFFLDSIAPQTTLVVGDPRFSTTTLFVTAATPLGLTASEPALIFYAVDSSTFAAYSGTFTLAAVGAHTVQFYSIDLAGNVEATRVTQAAVDGLPPHTAVSFGEPKYAGSRLYLSSTTKVQFTVADDLAAVGDEGGAGAAQTLLSVDSGSFAAALSTFSLSSEGEHALSWYSRDLVGNTELAVSTSVAVDLTPPVTRLEISMPLVLQASGTVVGPATVMSLAAQDLVSGGIASGLKDTFLAVSASVFALAPSTFTLAGADGARVVSFYSRDNVLNAEQVVSATVLLDATPPVSVATIGAPLHVAADGTRYVTPATPVVFSAQDPVVNGVTAGLDRIEVAVDGAAFTAYVSTLTFAEGPHTILFRGVDLAGNVEAAQTLRLQSDATPPVTALQPSSAYFAAAGRDFAPPSFTYALPAQDPVAGGVASGLSATLFRVDGSTFARYVSTFSLAEGPRRVDFESEDNVGNRELLKSATIFVDATPPVTDLSIGAPRYAAPDGTLFVGPAAPFALASQDPAVQDSASGVSAVSARVDAAAFAVYAATFTLSPGDGLRTVSWFAADNVGNAETPKVSTVALDATPPQTSLLIVGGRQLAGPDASTFYASSDTRLVLVSMDPAVNGLASGVTFTRWRDGVGAFQTYLSGLALAEGAHGLAYQSADNVENLEVARSTNVWIDAAPPVSSFAFGAPYHAAPDGTHYVTPTTPVTFSANDPALPTGQPGSGVSRLEVAVDGGPFAAYTSSQTFAEGRHTVLYRSIDGVANIEATRTLDVRSDATAPLTALALSGGHQFQGPDASSFFASADTLYALPAADPVVKDVASGAAFTRRQDNGGPFQFFAAPFTLAEGVHRLDYQSQDHVQNLEVPRSTTALVDATAPRTALKVVGGHQFPGPGAATFYASSDTRLALPAADPVAGGVASGLAFTRYQDGDGSFQTFVSTFGLSEGAHRLGYQSQDNVHNLEVLRSTNVWIDAAPPASSFAFGTPFYQAPDGTRYVTPATPVTFAANDPALPTGQPGSGVARIEVAVDGGPFIAYASALTFAEGRHTVSFRAIDNVANAEAVRTLQLSSDATPPVSSLSIGQPRHQLPGVLLVSTRTLFSIDAVDPIVKDAASGAKDTFYRVSDLAASSSAFTTFAAPFSLGGPDVTKFIEFYSRDNVLNTEAAKSSAVLLDSTGPELALRSPGTCDSGICRVLNGRFPVLGTAQDAHFQSYALESAPGKDAAAGFVLVSSAAVAVNSAALGVWDTGALSGWQTLRLTGTDQVHNAAVVALNVFVGDPATLLVLGGHETFNMPEGVAVGTDGKIYVADRDNHRVAVFSSTGAFLASYGGRERDEDDDHPRSSTSTLRLKHPSAVAVDGAGSIYVADTGHHRVLKLSAAGEVLLDVGRRNAQREEGEKGKVELEAEFKAGRAPGEFKKPAGVAVGSDGRIYVSDTDNHRVQVFSSTGVFALAFDLPPLPRGTEDDDEPRRNEKDEDDDRPELGKPAGIALDSAGNVYVADPKGSRALAFDAAGRLVMTVPVSGRKPGKSAWPVGVAVSPSGDCLLVSDHKSGLVLKYDFQGNLNLSFGGKGREDNEDGGRRRASSIKLRKPSGLAMDAAGALYVVDRNNERIKKFSLPDGSATAVMPPQGPDEDHNVAREVIDREDGGQVERKDRAAVSIPADALPEDLKISVTTPTATVAAESRRGADDKNMKVASPPVEYQPHGTAFEKPVTLTIPYNPELLAAQNAGDEDLKVHYWNPKKKAWEELESTVDKPNRVVRAKTTHFSLYQVFTGTAAPAAISPLAADASFGLKAAYAFPNPARGVGLVTIRIQPGLADSVQVNVYDVSGRKVHSSSDFRNLGAFDDGNGLGAQFTYEHVWDISGVGSGVYAYVITARKSGERDIHRSGKIGVVK